MPLFGLLTFALLTGCSIPYVIVQGGYQLKLLAGRKPIAKAISGGALTSEQIEKLRLIEDVTAFAQDTLGMPMSGNYTRVSVNFHHDIFNVSACKPYKFEPHTWYFPIVGSVPYKGFFQEAHATRQAERLSKKGLDVMKREVAGYSTLGYFQDPVLPNMLAYDSIFLVDLIIHELSHGIFYFQGQSQFNESFANFVGHQGALAYFESRDGVGSERGKEAQKRVEDRQRHVQFMLRLSDELEQLYQEGLAIEAMKDRKEALLDVAVIKYSELPFLSLAYKGRSAPTLNNASLMSYRRYNAQPELFEALFEGKEGDWPAFYETLLGFEGDDAPFSSLEAYLK